MSRQRPAPHVPIPQTAPELLSAVRQRGARLWVENGRLRYKARNGMFRLDI